MRKLSKGLKPKENFHFSNEENTRMTRTNKTVMLFSRKWKENL